GVVEGSYRADGGAQAAVADAVGQLGQLGAVSLDDEVGRQGVGGAGLGWAGDGHEDAAGSNQCGGALRDVAAEDVEDEVDLANVLQGGAVEVDELLGAGV